MLRQSRLMELKTDCFEFVALFILTSENQNKDLDSLIISSRILVCSSISCLSALDAEIGIQ